MDVFVIPVGADRYELYYEQQITDTEPDEEPRSTGMFARLQRRFGELVRAAEERRHRAGQETTQSWLGRLQERMWSWAAERIAEQRLLWNLRWQERAVAMHPTDVTFDSVKPHIDRVLQRDYERHRLWVLLDGVAFVATFVLLGPLFLLIPGVANLPAIYFGFRVIGHWLSMRGAAHARQGVTWEGQSCQALDDLRTASHLPRRDRQKRVQQIASLLHLRYLPMFFDRAIAKKT
jgi:hypothetical protein